MVKAQYDKLLRVNITRHYKNKNEDAYDEINAEAQVIANELGIANRMDVMAKREAFITLKDHKENFENSLLCRLINPAKSEMELVSKQILDNINLRLKQKLDVTLWKNSAAVIKWFRSIEMKENCMFTNFNIVEFYPTISEDFLNSALLFAKRHIKITGKDRGARETEE